MFVTFAPYEIQLRPSICPNHLRMWTAVEMGLEIPWFHASFLFHDGEEDRVRSLLTVSYDELKAPRTDERWHALIGVQLVSPGWLNGQGVWRMDPLTEIRLGTVKKNEVFLFFLANGECLTDPGVTPNKVKNQRTLFLLDKT